MSNTEPMFAGQTMTAFCAKAKKRTVRIAKSRKGELLWWCNHTEVAKTKAHKRKK